MAHILIVDDEAGIREFIADVLEDDGHEATQAEDGLAALHQLHARAFDLLITDLRMPGMTGLEFIRSVHERDIDAEMVMVTAHATVASAVEAMRYGAHADYDDKSLGHFGLGLKTAFDVG